MPVFRDAAQLYDCVGAILAYLIEVPAASQAFLRAGLIVHFRYREPEAEITMDGSKEPITLTLGPCNVTPIVEMAMTGDVAHQFWLGHVNLLAALTRGTIVAKGPIPAILRLLPAITPAYTRYPEILREKGLVELITA